MDKEKARAEAAEAAGLAVATAASAVPVFGGPAAVVAQYFGSIPAKRLLERTLDELRRDVTRALEMPDGGDVKILETDAFIAATMKVVRESLETSDEGKRQCLRNALINGYVRGPISERDRFLSLVSAYEPEHILVLQTLVAAQERQKERIPNASQRIAHLLADSLDSASVGPLLRDLVRDGLVADIDDGRIEDQNVGMPPHTESRPVLRAQHYHDVTNRGHGFLAFIAGPFDSRDSVPQVT